MLEGSHAGLLRLLVLGADIDLARGILPDQHHRKPRRHLVFALDARHLGGDTGAKLGGDAFSIDDLRRHDSIPEFVISLL